MKLKQPLNAQFVTAIKEAYVSKKTGKEGFTYKITLMIAGNACTLPCTEQVYLDTLDFGVLNDIQLYTEYHTIYDSYRVVELA